MRMRDLIKLLDASTGWVECRLAPAHYLVESYGGRVVVSYRTKKPQPVGLLSGHYRLVLRRRRLFVQRRMYYEGRYQYQRAVLLRYVTVRGGSLLVTAPGGPELRLSL